MANELTPSEKQYQVDVEMHYSTELSGNWIWQEDLDMDDEMRAVVQIHDGSPLFKNDEWYVPKLRQLAKFLTQLAAEVELGQQVREKAPREQKTFDFPGMPTIEMAKFPEFGHWIGLDKTPKGTYFAWFVAIDDESYRGEVEDWGDGPEFKKTIEEYFSVELI